jgi:hypothetical protein
LQSQVDERSIRSPADEQRDLCNLYTMSMIVSQIGLYNLNGSDGGNKIHASDKILKLSITSNGHHVTVCSRLTWNKLVVWRACIVADIDADFEL